MKRLAKRFRRTESVNQGIRPLLPRPDKTVAISRRDYGLLQSRSYTDQLAPRYFKGIDVGTVVRIEPLFNADHREFRLARLAVHPKNPFMRVYTRVKAK